MFSSLIPLVLSAQLIPAGPSFVEEIRIVDSLVISAEYMPQGSVLTSESMVLSVEDFGILQAEVESSTEACNLRLDALKAHHEEQVMAMERRCEERNQTYRSELDKSLELNAELQKNLDQERKAHTMQKWINVGIVVSGAIVTTVVLTR